MKEVTIFDLLNEIENQNYAFYDTLSKEQQQILFKPVVVLMWLTSSQSSVEQLSMLDELVNRYLFNFNKHPKLLYLLMCACGEHKKKKWKFVKRDVKQQQYTETISVVESYYNCSPREAVSYIQLLNVDDVKEMCAALGYEPTQIKGVIKEWQ